MVAIVSGNSLGLSLTSLATLGQRGVFGSAGTGRDGGLVYVNAANGNLVLQSQDALLAGRGRDAASVRTYNSQGQLTDDNGDNWSNGIFLQQLQLNGTRNTAGSTLVRTDRDGAKAVYTYDVDAGLYVSDAGPGAFDTIAYDSSNDQFAWADGATGEVERYDADTGRLMTAVDTSGNALGYTYDGAGRLASMTTAAGETVYLDYVGSNISQLRVVRTTSAGTETLTTTRYAYDAQNRLASVIVDLSPEDNSVGDSHVYVTSYTYDGASDRVATVSQTDRTSLAITYVQVGGEYRVETLTNAAGEVTRFTYDVANRRTTVTDPLQLRTVYAYDARGQLLSVTAPAMDGVSQVTTYAYDAAGNLTAVTDPTGRTVAMAYDARGNLTTQRDAAGNTVTRTYDEHNQLATETVYAVPDSDGAGPAQPGAPATSRFVYDATGRNQLRFAISAAGHVTEYRYDAQGNQVETLQYGYAPFDTNALGTTAVPSETDMVYWAREQDPSRTGHIARSFDFRGQVTQERSFGVADENGNVDAPPVTVNYVYDSAGRLLTSIAANKGLTSYTYDGLGRVQTATDALDVVTVNRYDDADRRSSVMIASGLVTTSTYDAAGRLLTVVQGSDAGAQLGETRYRYDADGRLLMSTDPTGVSRWSLYDDAGRKVGDVDADGTLTEYVYLANNLLAGTIVHATRVNTALLANAGEPLQPTLAAIRPAPHGGDQREWRVYDNANRLVQVIDGLGYVTQTTYDGASHVLSVTRYATHVTVPATGFTPITAPVAVTANSAADRVTRSFYDVDGRVIGELDAENYYTHYEYDAAGRVVAKTRYASPMVGTLTDARTPPQLVAEGAPAPVGGYVRLRTSTTNPTLPANVGNGTAGATDAASLLARLQAFKAADPEGAFRDLVSLVRNAHVTLLNAGFNGVALLRQWIAELPQGSPLFSTLAQLGVQVGSATVLGGTDQFGDQRDSLLIGSAGLDRLDGGRGDDTLSGANFLNGGSGNDVYLFGFGDGHVQVEGEVGEDGIARDVVQLRPGITKADIELSGDSRFLTIKLVRTGDTLSTQGQMREIRFADGTVWTAADFEQRLAIGGSDNGNYYSSDPGAPEAIRGRDGDDNLTGGYGNDTIAGGSGNDNLTGSGGADLLLGGDGDDRMIGGSSPWWESDPEGDRDTLDGGAGNDTLSSNGGRDVYVFGIGSGNDFIEVPGATMNDRFQNADTLRLTAGITPEDLIFTRSGDDLVISLRQSADSITIQSYFRDIETEDDWYGGFARGIEYIEFSDGTTWEAADIQARLDPHYVIGGASPDAITGTDGSDFLIGRGGNDTLEGGAGNDTIMGAGDDDVFIFGLGSGVDVISAGWSYGDTLKLGVPSDWEQLRFQRFDEELQIRISPRDMAVIRRGQIGFIEFSDGVVIDASQIEALTSRASGDDDTLSSWGEAVDGLEGNDYLWSSGGNSTLRGGAGRDTLMGAGGDDDLAGGVGNDSLVGYDGRDVYRFSIGGGADTIDNRDQGFGDPQVETGDKLLFGDGIAPEQIRLARNGLDLVLSIVGSNDSVTLRDYFSYENEGERDIRLTTVEFAGGQTWTRADIAQRLAMPPATAGNDLLTGTSGLDAFTFQQGFGNDTIVGFDGSGSTPDEIHFGEGITAAQLRGVRNGDDLVLFVPYTADRLEVPGYFLNRPLPGGPEQSEVIFADGTTWTYSTVVNLTRMVGQGDDYFQSHQASADQLYGLAGDDTLIGTDFGDTIEGNAGDDLLDGRAGNDVYRFGWGDGHDTIVAGGAAAGDFDTVEFGDDVRPTDLSLVVEDGTIIVSLKGTSDRLVIESTPNGSRGALQVQQFRFANGEAWNQATILARATSGTNRLAQIEGFDFDDTLTGGNEADKLLGFGGSDLLLGGNGVDHLDGGAGDDTLDGGSGNDYITASAGTDLFRLGHGSGMDRVSYDDGWSGQQIVEIAAGVKPTDVVVFRDDSNNVVVRIVSSGDQITFGEALPNEIRFVDGTVWNQSAIATEMAQHSVWGLNVPTPIVIEPEGLRDVGSVLTGAAVADAPQLLFRQDGNTLEIVGSNNAATRIDGWYSSQATHVDQFLINGTSLMTTPVGDAASVQGRDQTTHLIYDALGRLVGEVDAENFLTERVYNEAGQVASTIRYSRPLTIEVTGNETVLDLRPSGDKAARVTTTTYDLLGRVVKEVNPEGLITEYVYDQTGNLTATQRSSEYDGVRIGQARYDLQGRLIGELSGEGSALLLTAEPLTEEQIQAIWDQYGIAHTYDAAGRRINTIDANGNRTVFYYDADGRLRYTVNAEGEVQEQRYNALNQLEKTVLLANRLPGGSLAGLHGGMVDHAVEQLVEGQYDLARDTVTGYTYTVRGQLQTTTDALSHTATTDYNAFGEAERVTAVDGLETSLVRDRRGQVTSTVTDPADAHLTAKAQYDAFGRLVRSEDASGKVSAQVFDRLGRVVQTVDPSGARRATTWDAFDRKLTQTDALGNTTTYAYDDKELSIRVTTPEGVSVQTYRSAFGQTVLVIDADNNQTEYRYDLDGRLTSTIDARQKASTNHYDAGGRLMWSEDANHLRTEFTYDGANRVLTRTVDPQGLALTTTYGYDAKGQTVSVEDPNGTITTTEYDVLGRVLKQIVDPTGLHIQTSFTYDEAGRTLTVVDANRVTTSYGYDTVGRRTFEVRDPGGLNLTKSYSYDKSGNVLVTQITDSATQHVRAVKTVYDVLNRPILVTDPSGGLTYYEYDAEGRVLRSTQLWQAVDLTSMPAEMNAATAAAFVASRLSPDDRVVANHYDRDGRLRYNVDGTGAVVELRYDARGNVVDRIAYANRIDLASWDGVSEPLVDASDADRHVRTSYDALNRAEYVADALGYVTHNEYDDVGHLVRQTAHAIPIGVESWSLVAPNSPDDRATVFVYDKAGRVTETVDPMGAVTRNVYDDNGNVIEQTRVAMVMPSWTALDQVVLDPGEDRTVRTTYDAANRPVYVVDAAGFVTTTVYDAMGRVQSTTRWAKKPAEAGNLPPASPGVDQTTSFTYDDAGRVLTTTDAEGKTESYTYNAFGDKTSFTNKKGSVWNYEYDGAGRMVRETSPAVTLTQVTLDGNNDLVESTSDTERVVTVLTYDGVGNLTSRTEAFGRPEQRTTSYTYDARGRQTGVTYPPALVYWESRDGALSNGAAGGVAARTEEWRILSTSTAYDAFGNAVSNTDVAGNKSFKVYDKSNRVVFDIDALGHVTQYKRNGFGDALEVTRFSTGAPVSESGQLLVPESLTEQIVKSWLTNVSSRTVWTQYDKLGRAVVVQEATAFTYSTDMFGPREADAAKVTINTYDVFGGLVRTEQEAGEVNGRVATYQYYDVLGRVIEKVDAGGYRTSTTYDEFGNVKSTKEWANANGGYVFHRDDPFNNELASIDDRVVSYTYDRLNRKTTETRENVLHSTAGQALLGQSQRGNLTTSYGYDAVGNVTVTTDALGGKTYSYYDAMGRVTAVAAPTRATAAGASTTITPVTLFRRDVYGNVVVTVELANGALGQVAEFKGVSDGTQLAGLVGNFSTEDGQTFASYDLYGHVLQTTDAERHSTFSSYNESGQVAKTWQGVTSGQRFYEGGVDEAGNGIGKMLEDSTAFKLFEYDKLGRLIRTYEPGPATKLDDTGVPATNGAVTEQTIVESSTVGWGESGPPNPGDESGPTNPSDEGGPVNPTKEFLSGNSVRISWVNLADASLGNVRVELDYFTSTDDGQAAVARSYAQEFGPGDTRRTVMLTWNDSDPNGPHGISSISAVRVQQRVNGDWVTLWNSDDTGGPADGENGYRTIEAPRRLVTTELNYNAYGELISKGINGGAQEYFDYDSVGRLWRTNSGDGIDKIYLYDQLGRVVSELRSDGSGGHDLNLRSINSAEEAVGMIDKLRSTETVYDDLGRATETRGAKRKTETTAQSVNGRPEATSAAITSAAGIHGTTEAGDTYWAGTNTVSLGWPNLSHLGSGEIKVELTYTTAELQARPDMHDESGNYVGGYTPVETRSIDAVFNAEDAANGVTMSWASDGPAAAVDEAGNAHYGAGGIGGVSAVRVYKRDANGDWQLLHDPTPGVPTKVLDVGRPADANATTRLEVRPAGSQGDWSEVWQAPITFAQAQRYDMGFLGGAEYEYRLVTDVNGTSTTVNSGLIHADGTAETTFVETGFFIRPTVRQSFDRWGNVISTTDARSSEWVTTYEYNADDQVIAEHKASGDWESNGPTTRAYYDALGRQVAMRDANGNVNSQVYDAGGNILEEHHADGGVVKHTYDAFGNKIRTVNAEGNRAGLNPADQRDATTISMNTTDYAYDKMHRLVETRHGAVTVATVTDATNPEAAMQVQKQVVTLIDRNEYDQAGRRVSQTVGSYVGAVGEVTRYKFDLAGRVIETIQPGGGDFRTSVVYDDQGRKIAEVDQNGNASKWTYDYFGKMLKRTDLGGGQYEFRYDHAGQLTETFNSRYSLTQRQLLNTYNAAGELTSIHDASLNQMTEYWYDLSGQHVREKTTQDGVVYQDNVMAYDELGRLRHVSDGRMSIDIAYDAVGNRVNLRTHVNVPTLEDPTVDVAKDRDVWFTYDSMNRQTGAELLRRDNGDGTFRYDFNVQLNGIDIVPGVSGHKITYDLNGNRTSDTYLGTKVKLVEGTAPTYYEEDGQLYELTPGTDARYEIDHMPMHWEVTETYDYDALGRLTGARRDGIAIDQRMYDQAGRVVVQGPQNLAKSYSDAINQNVAQGDTFGQEYRLSRYDANGRLLRQQAFTSDQARMTSDTKYTSYDKAGNLQSYSLTVPGEYTNTYTFERAKFDGYKEKSNHGTSTKFEDGQIDSYYDVNGNLVRLDDHTKNENDRSFVNDLTGRALYVKQGTAIQRQVVVNGEVLGRYGIGVNERNPKDKDGNPNFIVLADFTSGYQPITGNYPSASVGSYQVQAGDTLRSIARQSYGDEGLWYRIAETNGLSGDRDLRVGQTITIPSAVGTIRNNTGTYQPYDPSKITGDTMPHMPTPHASGGGCGGIGMLLVVVVAVVVTVFTAGAAAVAMGATGSFFSAGAAAFTTLSVESVAAVAIGSAVGSIVSQGVAIAIGQQEKFSWTQVAMSAIGGAATAALPVGAFTGALGQAGGMAVRAAVGNAIGQGIGVATGLQEKFNWRGVAASAAASYVSQSLSDAVLGEQMQGPLRPGETLGRSGGWVGALGGGDIAKIAGSTVLGVASGATAAIARGGKFTIQQVAVDAFGNALGESLASQSQPEPSVPAPASADEKAAILDLFRDGPTAAPASAYTGGQAWAADVAARRADSKARQVDELLAGVGADISVDTRPGSVYVQAGDSLSKIAARFPEYGSVNDLKNQLIAANPQLRDPNALTEGMELNFPGAGTVVDRAAMARAVGADGRYQAALAAQQPEAQEPVWNMRDASAALRGQGGAPAVGSSEWFRTASDAELHAAGYQTARASDPAEGARIAMERQRAGTAIGIAAGGPVFTGLAAGARLFGAPDNVVNDIGVAQTGLVMSLAAPLASQGAVIARPLDPRFDPSVEAFINLGKQSRHVLRTREYESPTGGKSYFRQMSDAQDVLSAYQSGQAVVVGRGNDGGPIVRFDAGVGFNHNPRAGFPNQPTNVYWIKGTSSVSVVPVSPTKGQ